MFSFLLFNTVVVSMLQSEMDDNAKWIYNCPASGYYENCNDEEREIYDLVLCSILTGRDTVEFKSTLSESELKSLITYVIKDRRITVNIYEANVQFSRIYDADTLYGDVSSGTYQVRFKKGLLDDIDVNNYLCRLEIENVLSNVDKNWSDLETLQYFHDYVAENTVYQHGSSNCHNISGVFIDGEATCQAYSRAFNLLCELFGYEAVEVSGESRGEAHMWSRVCVDDEWYSFDVTWDDTIMPGVVLHNYFGMPIDLMNQTHTIKPTYKQWVPEGTNSRDFWYAWKQNWVIPDGLSDIEFLNFVVNRAATEHKQGVYYIEFVGEKGEDLVPRFRKISKRIISILQSTEDYKVTKSIRLISGSGNICVLELVGC